jgi:outer membrane protein assembly factor BamB
MVAVPDAVYIAHGQACLVIDPATGKESAAIKTPGGASGSWRNLRVAQQHLLGTIGRELICLSRSSGEPVWKYTCARPNLSTAVGGGKVYCAELLDTRRGENPATAGTKLRAFDLETGRLVWEVDGGAAVRYSEVHDLVVTTGGVFSGKDGTRIRDSAPPAQIAGENLISGNADNFVVYDVASGAQSGQAIHWFRRGCTGLRSSCHIVTTRFKGNAAFMDLQSREITPLWNIRPGCNNNLFPANGILNVPNVTGGCECNYTPASKAFAPMAAIRLAHQRE